MMENFLNPSISDINKLMEVIKEIIYLPNEQINPVTVEAICSAIEGSVTPSIREEMISALVDEMRTSSKKEIEDSIANFEEAIEATIEEIPEGSGKEGKAQIIRTILNIFYSVMKEAAERVGKYDTIVSFELVHPNAKIPTYAHDTDAGADIYAPETVTIPAGSIGFLVKTGLRMGMVNGNWALMIYPRSGLSLKTGLRISNSVGVVDSMYRNEIGILFDNISCEDYTINAGDRIAQFILTPIHRFRAQQVEDVTTIGDDRNGGFGSTNK